MSVQPAATSAPTLHDRFLAVRRATERLCETLTPEDCQVQSMTEASPVRWHLAHTTWFFETFVLVERLGRDVFDERFPGLFNSYYNSLGEPFPRAQRGLVTRPGLERVREYRAHVDREIAHLLQAGVLEDGDLRVLEVGLQHEQQHQELILTDLKHALAKNPAYPTFREGDFRVDAEASPLPVAGGIHEIGHDGQGFSFDNEGPRHEALVPTCALDARLVTAGEYMAFMQDGAYEDPLLWLSLGWDAIRREGWRAPLYWFERDGRWWHFTLAGAVPVDPEAPVTHVSYFEAEAYARWADARLPTEFEWEVAARGVPVEGSFADVRLDEGRAIHPSGHGLYGEVWQWTTSSYAPYPGYRPAAGAIGEYNGKFMCNQYVLRGGSCATPSGHTRATYRNFFPPEARWQFAGIRLARDSAS